MRAADTPSTSTAPTPSAAAAPAPKSIPPPKVPAGVVYQPDIVTGTGGGRPLHVDAVWPEKLPAGLLPAILFVHGGGWAGGSHKFMRPMFLATRGYFVATVEYRLSGEATWPAQIEDCKLAVRWLRANAPKYHVDPDRIGVWGESAGGHLVACLGTIGPEASLEGEGGYPGVSSKVQAVVDFFGPVDFLDPAAGETNDSAAKKMLGGSVTEKPEVWKQASPRLSSCRRRPAFSHCPWRQRQACACLFKVRSSWPPFKKQACPQSSSRCRMRATALRPCPVCRLRSRQARN